MGSKKDGNETYERHMRNGRVYLGDPEKKSERMGQKQSLKKWTNSLRNTIP